MLSLKEIVDIIENRIKTAKKYTNDENAYEALNEVELWIEVLRERIDLDEHTENH